MRLYLQSAHCAIWRGPRGLKPAAQLCRRSAFTAVEFIVVLAIVAIFATIAVPRFANSLAQRRVEGAVRRITSDLAFARRRAKLTSTSLTVTFDLGVDAYELEGMQHPDHPGRGYVVSLSDTGYGATIVSADLGDDAEIVFDGYGMPDSGGTIVISVGNFQETITVDGTSGRIVKGGLILKEIPGGGEVTK